MRAPTRQELIRWSPAAAAAALLMGWLLAPAFPDRIASSMGAEPRVFTAGETDCKTTLAFLENFPSIMERAERQGLSSEQKRIAVAGTQICMQMQKQNRTGYCGRATQDVENFIQRIRRWCPEPPPETAQKARTRKAAPAEPLDPGDPAPWGGL